MLRKNFNCGDFSNLRQRFVFMFIDTIKETIEFWKRFQKRFKVLLYYHVPI